MKLCANISMLFTEVPLPERFAAARACDFKAVEIQFPYSDSLTELKQRQDENELAITLINVGAGDLMDGGEGLASHPKRQDDFKRAVDQCLHYAEALQVGSINVLAGRCRDRRRTEHYMDTFLHNLDYCADQCQPSGIKAVFEAINTHDMPDFLIHSTAHMQQVLKDLNHDNLAMQYDLYHMARMQEPLEQQLPDILPQIGHIQFADTPDRHEPGSGELAFAQVFQQLRELEYHGWIGAEYKPSGPTVDSLSWKDQYF